MKITKKLKWVIMSCVLVIVASLGMYKVITNPSVNYEMKTFQMKKIDTGSLENLSKDKGAYTIYIGRKTCPDCVSLINQTTKVLNDEKQSKVYYFDTDQQRNDKNFDEVTDSLNIGFVPVILKIKDGNITQLTAEDINNYGQN
ncbi:hypothetical protein [Enterococcus faecium]|uniref:hypothetical protein n=1 Tax=Enterococcus faecium TaxID=1352 RepID=UPI0012FDDBFD|nr:hypothetical protein [Enterococcus faecium]